MRPLLAIPDVVPAELRSVVKTYVSDVARLFGDRLESIVLYGSAARGEYVAGRSNLNFLLVLAGHDGDALRRYARAHRRWAKESIVAPLMLSPAEITATQRQFPLEYFDIQHINVLLHGTDPFAALTIDDRALADECLQQLDSHTIRVRQRVIEAAGKSEGELMLLPLSIAALLPVLRGLLRVAGQVVPARTEPVLAEIEKHLDVPVDAFRDAWRVKRGEITPGAVEIPRLLDRHLVAIQALTAATRRMIQP